MAVTHFREFEREGGQRLLVSYHYRNTNDGSAEVEIVLVKDDASGEKVEVSDSEREYFEEQITEHHEWWND
jgi:hypothetical protein